MERVAIIGVSEHYRSSSNDVEIECFAWHRTSKLRNLSDFDTVIVNLLTLKDHGEPDWKSFFRAFSLSTVVEIVRHSGRIIIVGDPRFPVRWFDSPNDPVDRQFLDWTGINFDWDDRPGKKVIERYEDYLDRNAYGEYLSHLDAWSYSLRSHGPRREKLQEEFGFTGWLEANPHYRFGVREETFCSSRFDTLIAGRLKFVVTNPIGRNSYGIKEYQDVATFGSIVLLPATRLDSEESMRVILRDVVGADVSISVPEWVELMPAPGQETIDAAISTIEGKIAELAAELAQREEERRLIRAPLRLLYSMGIDLEEAVRDVFAAIGANVELDSQRPNEEDGLITVDGISQVGVLEVKGTKRSSFEERHHRQLQDWVSRALDRAVDSPKGIFAGNASIELPPVKRSSPFGHNFIKSAGNRGFAVLATEDLYICYWLDRLNELDRDEFWYRLFATRGIFDASEYREALRSCLQQ